MKSHQIKAEYSTSVDIYLNKIDPKKRIEISNSFRETVFKASLSDTQNDELLSAVPHQCFKLSDFDDPEVIEMFESYSNDIEFSETSIKDSEKNRILDLIESNDGTNEIEDILESFGYYLEESEIYIAAPFEIKLFEE